MTYRVFWALVDVSSGEYWWKGWRCRAERRERFLWWERWVPVTNWEWRTTWNAAAQDADADAALRNPVFIDGNPVGGVYGRDKKVESVSPGSRGTIDRS